MNADKLCIEVLQGMQDLTRLLKKATAVKRKLNIDFKSLVKEGVPTEMEVALDLQADKLHDATIGLEGAMNE